LAGINQRVYKSGEPNKQSLQFLCLSTALMPLHLITPLACLAGLVFYLQ